MQQHHKELDYYYYKCTKHQFIRLTDTSKTAKIIKKWYHSLSHSLTVSVLLNKIMFIWTQSLSNAFRQFTVYIRINIISELFRPVEKKSNSLISNCIAAMILSSFCITIKGLSSPWVYLAQIWRYGASKIMGSRLWSFGVTWPFDSRGRPPIGGPYSDHASILLRYGDVSPMGGQRW